MTKKSYINNEKVEVYKQLIKDVQKGVKDAFDKLFVLYQKECHLLAASFYASCRKNRGFSFDDVLDVAYSSFFEATLKFDLQREANLSAFYAIIFKRNMLRFIRENSYDYSARMFSGSISLDEPAYSEGHSTYSDILTNDSLDNTLLYSHDLFETFQAFINTLNVPEKTFLMLSMNGYKTNQIAEQLQVDPKLIYTIHRSIKRKYHKFYGDNQ